VLGGDLSVGLKDNRLSRKISVFQKKNVIGYIIEKTVLYLLLIGIHGVYALRGH
jgi:hypothetical protein